MKAHGRKSTNLTVPMADLKQPRQFEWPKSFHSLQSACFQRFSQLKTPVQTELSMKTCTILKENDLSLWTSWNTAQGPSVVFVFSRLDVLFDCSAAKQFQQVLIVSENDNIALWQLFDILWQILWQTLWQTLWIGEAQKLYLDCVLLQICFSNYYCMYYI